MIRFRSHSRPWQSHRPEPVAAQDSPACGASTTMRTHHRRSGRACLRSAGFAGLFSYFPPSPSHGPPRTSASTLFPLSLRGKILDHFAETFDSSRVVDLLPENNGGGRNADDFTVENFVTNSDEISLVVGPIDHRDQTLLLGSHDALQLDFVDQESRRSRQPRAGLKLRRRSDQRLERIASALRIVVILLADSGSLEDFLKDFLDVARSCRCSRTRLRRCASCWGRGPCPPPPARRRPSPDPTPRGPPRRTR